MFALVVAPSPGFLILIYVGLLQEQAIQEEKSVYKSKKTTVCGESFYYSVHDAYAAMLNEHTIQWHVRKGCIAQLIHASPGLVLGCRDLILLVLGIACIDIRIMLPHPRAELHNDTFVVLCPGVKLSIRVNLSLRTVSTLCTPFNQESSRQLRIHSIPKSLPDKALLITRIRYPKNLHFLGGVHQTIWVLKVGC